MNAEFDATIARRNAVHRYELAKEFAMVLVRTSPGMPAPTVAERAYLLADAMIERRKA